MYRIKTTGTNLKIHGLYAPAENMNFIFFNRIPARQSSLQVSQNPAAADRPFFNHLLSA